ATIDGSLDIDVIGGFVPVLGQIYEILSATAGVSGAFDIANLDGLPAGLMFDLNYLPTAV
ncbi:MAG: hypothetical protein H0T51_25140, partial [Pirellulales bacterium]|nr:hypothetical protein [Pirellulales bacterium]